MSEIRLSICIPTYNFGSFIGETLDSLTQQMTGEVEVVIVDGASTDNTPDVVRQASANLPRLTYHRRERNMGVDRDLAKTVELAKGDYCWFLSSDDVPAPGTIKRILDELALGHDIYLFNRMGCDQDLTPIRTRPWLSGKYQDHVFDCANPSELIEYLDATQSLGALFSYISSIVVSRCKWNAVGFDEMAAGTHYAHVVRILSIIKGSGTVRYIRDALVQCRGHNDSFSTKGLIPRLLIDFHGYDYVMQHVFPADDTVHKLVKTVMRREHRWFMLARARGTDARQWQELREALVRYGYRPVQLFCLDMISPCRPVIRVLRRLRQAAIGLKGAFLKGTGQV